MRSSPKSRTWWALLIFAAVSVFYAMEAYRDYRLSPSQAYLSAAAMKQRDPGLFPRDEVFGSSMLWRCHTPSQQWLIYQMLNVRPSCTAAAPFRLMVAPVTLLYLCGMYMLLYRQCRSWSVSAFIAVLSTTVIDTVGTSYWGMGSLASMTPWAISMALTPLLLLAYIRSLQRPMRLAGVFLLTGLLANVHPVMALNLATVLGLTYLVYHRLSLRAWGMTAVFAVMSAAGAAPILTYLAQLRASPGAGGTATFQTACQAFELAPLGVLFGDVLTSAWNWVLLSIVVLAIPAVVIFTRSGQLRIPNVTLWVSYLLTAVFVALGLHGLMQLIGYLRNSPPPVVDFLQAGSLLMPVLYVLLAQTATYLFRIARRGGRMWVRLVLGLIAAAWMLPSDNLRVLRRATLDTATMFMDESDKPRSILQHHSQEAKYGELQAIARRAATLTDRSAVFITDQPQFRMLSGRTVAACPDDIKYAYYMAPGKLATWLDRLTRQAELLHPPVRGVDPPALQAYARGLASVAPFAGAEEWYVILETSQVPETHGPLIPLHSADWGRHYGLYRLNLTTTAPSTATDQADAKPSSLSKGATP